MAVELRDLVDADVDWCVDLLMRWDATLGEDLWRRSITGQAAPIVRNRVAVLEGRLLATGGVATPEGLPYPIMMVVVDPSARGQGVGSMLFADLVPHIDAPTVGAGMPDHDEASFAIVQHWGFEVLGHGIDSVLPLAALPAPARLPADVRVVHLPVSDAAGSPLDVDGFLALVGDFPEVEIYGSRITNEVLRQMAPEARWVLLVDEAGILAGTVVVPRAGGEWYVGFTASAPRARGRGLARLVKDQAHHYARAHGATAMRTTNEERNDRIRALNASMGYVRASGDLRLVRQLGTRQQVNSTQRVGTNFRPQPEHSVLAGQEGYRRVILRFVHMVMHLPSTATRGAVNRACTGRPQARM